MQKLAKEKDDFFDGELENMRIHKNQLYKQAQYANDQTKWDEYKHYKNEYKATIKRKRYEQMQKQLDKVQGDSKRTWKFLNSIITDRDESDSYDTVVLNDKVLCDKSEIANEFNKYFVETIRQINESIPSVDQIDIIQHPPPREFGFEFRKVSVSQVDKYLHDMEKKLIKTVSISV